LTKDIALLGTPYFNLYVVKGETYAIIEGGVSAVTYPFLEQLDQIEVPGESISHLVILHSHFDHMMVFPTLRERYPWLKVVSSKKNQAIFSNQRIMTKIFDSDRRVTLAMMERGLISEAPSLIPSSFPLDLPVQEGSILDLGKGMKVRFIDTPGHSPDCINAYIEDQGVLFCTDAAGFYNPPDFFRPNYWFNLAESDRSFRKMKALDPEILCRGHYGVILGREPVRKNLEAAHQSIEEFKSLVLDRIQGGCSIDDTAREVTDRFSKGFLELFPPGDNLHLWKLLIRRTLEYLGLEVKEDP